MKTCKTCHETKPNDGFYARGLECRICTRKRVKSNRLANSEYYRQYYALHPGKHSKPLDRAKANEASCRCYRANKHKWLARGKVRRAVASGKITVPPSCSRCGLTGTVEAHHEDYGRPLDVVWLCKMCHENIHKTVVVPADFAPKENKWRSSGYVAQDKPEPFRHRWNTVAVGQNDGGSFVERACVWCGIRMLRVGSSKLLTFTEPNGTVLHIRLGANEFPKCCGSKKKEELI
jgi:hypothetical protein